MKESVANFSFFYGFLYWPSVVRPIQFFGNANGETIFWAVRQDR